MSGHNKWSKIKHKKAALDAKKSSEFSKIARLISVESKKAGGDTSLPALRAAIEKARRANMPGENINKAVQKGKSGNSAPMESVLYETYGPGGVAIVVEGLTDNKNRTGAEIKHVLSKNGLVLSSQGSALWAFEKEEGAWKPKTFVSLADNEMKKLCALIEELRDNDDVQEIFVNARLK